MRVLTEAQKRQFAEEGYLLVEDLLDPEKDIQPILDEYAVVLDGIANKLYDDGTIGSKYASLPLMERLVAVCAESGQNFPQHFDFSLPQTGIKVDTPIHVGPAVFNTLAHPRMLDMAEDLMGSEIYSNPVQHIRFKLPARAVAQGSYNGLVSKIPWHQDNGVIMPEADESSILTVWLPLTNATIANGCLQVVPGSHRHGLTQHCPGPFGIAIPDQLVATQEAVAVEMRPGSALLMTQRTVHSSLDNVTDDEVRISMDLRYQPIGQPTGRPAFAGAGFNARSSAHPESVVRDPAIWAENWYKTRAALADDSQAFNRWRAGENGCA